MWATSAEFIYCRFTALILQHRRNAFIFRLSTTTYRSQFGYWTVIPSTLLSAMWSRHRWERKQGSKIFCTYPGTVSKHHVLVFTGISLLKLKFDQSISMLWIQKCRSSFTVRQEGSLAAHFYNGQHLDLFSAVFRIRIRIHRIHMFLGLPDPDPQVRGMDLDPSFIKQK